MSEIYVVRRTDKEVYKDKKNQNVTHFEQAHKTTLQKATNMLSGVKAAERSLWKVYSLDELNIDKEVYNPCVVPMAISQEKLESIKNIINDRSSFMELTNEICSTFAAIDSIKKDAMHDQSEADLALSDIYHFIEFTDNLNLAQTYKVMQLLKNVLKKRREAKNKILIANLYDKCSSQKITSGELKENVRNMYERQYNNRVLKDLSNIITMKKDEFNEYLDHDFLAQD